MRGINKILRKVLAVALWATTEHVAFAQINTEQVMNIGRNALYFEDYILSIQYFNQVIAQKPYLAEPYFFRAVAKISLDDYSGAEADATRCIEINPFIKDAYRVRGVARHNTHNFDQAIWNCDLATRTSCSIWLCVSWLKSILNVPTAA